MRVSTWFVSSFFQQSRCVSGTILFSGKSFLRHVRRCKFAGAQLFKARLLKTFFLNSRIVFFYSIFSNSSFCVSVSHFVCCCCCCVLYRVLVDVVHVLFAPPSAASPHLARGVSAHICLSACLWRRRVLLTLLGGLTALGAIVQVFRPRPPGQPLYPLVRLSQAWCSL